MTYANDFVEEWVFELLQRSRAGTEAASARMMGAVLCPSATHGDYVDGEVVPGDLPCRECGAAL